MLIHISGYTYVAQSEIAKIEGFPATLLIKVTLKTGEVFERFVSEKSIDWWADKDGIQTEHMRQKARIYAQATRVAPFEYDPVKPIGRDAAFEIELREFVNYARTVHK